MKSINLLLSLTLLLAAACNSAQSDAEKTANSIKETVAANSPAAEKPSANGTYMKATIDGKAWEANKMIPDLDPNSSYKRIQGEKGDISISFQLWKPQAGQTVQFSEDHAADLWAPDGIFGGRKGKVTITRADNQFVEGTFNFTATSVNNPGTHEITNGEFKVQATPVK
jgi:hypothetical protein